MDFFDNALILTNAIADKIKEEITEYNNGLVNLSSNSFIFMDNSTPLLPTITNIAIDMAITIPNRRYLLARGEDGLSSVDALYKITLY